MSIRACGNASQLSVREKQMCSRTDRKVFEERLFVRRVFLDYFAEDWVGFERLDKRMICLNI